MKAEILAEKAYEQFLIRCYFGGFFTVHLNDVAVVETRCEWRTISCGSLPLVTMCADSSNATLTNCHKMLQEVMIVANAIFFFDSVDETLPR